MAPLPPLMAPPPLTLEAVISPKPVADFQLAGDFADIHRSVAVGNIAIAGRAVYFDSPKCVHYLCRAGVANRQRAIGIFNL